MVQSQAESSESWSSGGKAEAGYSVNGNLCCSKAESRIDKLVE